MKLKLLFFMGILSVFCNTMNASNTGPVIPKPVSLPPTISADKLVQMNINPQVTCPGVIIANIVFYIDDDQTIFPNLVVTAISDNQAVVPDANLSIFGVSLGDRFLTVTPLSGIEGVANITITVKDGDNQTASLTFKVTAVDNSSPSISSASNQVGNVGSACQFSIPDYTGLVTATDDCLAPTITQVPVVGTLVSIGSTVVTLIATDSVGKTATTTFNVNVTDVEKPVITTSGNITENTTLGICGWTPSPVPSATATDNCTPMSNIPLGSRSDMLALNADYPVGTTTITWTVADDNGNTTSATQTVTVIDVERPTVITQDITVELDSAGNATITPVQIDNGSYDNCTIDTRILDISSFTCANLGANTVVLTVTDTAGNVATSSATVTVVDKIAPVITTIGNQVIDNVPGQCGRFIPVGTSGGLTITDNCTATGAIAITRTRSDGLSRYNPFPVGVTTVTWTATDASGNMSSASITVTVNDVEKPVITTSGDIVENNTLGVCGWTPSPVPSATATDNCTPMSNIPSGSRSDMLALNADYPVGTTTITWTVADDNGNTTSATQTVTVIDVERPTVITQDITVELDSAGNATITPTQINNGSYDNCGVAASLTLSLDITDFNCSNLGANTVVLTVTDTAGNVATSSATVTVVDKIAPVITTIGNQVLDNVPGQCGRFIPVGTSGGLTITDNCTATGAITITRTRSDGLSRYNPFPVGVTTVTWTATDASGNMSSASITVTVNDVEAPSFGSIAPAFVLNDSGLCSYATSQLSAPFVSDNCPFTGTVTVSPAIIPISAGPDHLPSTVTWTATDTAGNIASATQLVTVQDTEYPVVETKNIIRYFDANGQIVILPSDIDNGTTDNSGTSCLTQYVVPNILYCGNKGDNSVILTVTDSYGNQSYKEAIVTAIDDINPTITAPANVVLNTNSGCTWVGTLAIPVASDNCSVVSVTNDAPAALPVGDTTVIWTATDASGNTATATQTVTVNDVEKPIAIAKVGYTVTLDANGEATIVATDIDNASSDNCGIKSLALSKTSFDCDNVGSNQVTLTVTDNSDNVSTVDTVVTVVDAIAPEAIAQPITVQLNSIGGVSITAAQVNDGSTDNCGIKSITVAPSTFTCANVGDNTVTLTVTDNSNNVSTVDTIVTVEDNNSPVVVTKSFTAYLDASGSVSILASDVHLSSTDACGVKSMSVSPSTFTCNDIGENTVELSVTDINDNVTTIDAIVTVLDKIAPVVTTNPITVELDADGMATIETEDVNNVSTDNCGIVSYVLNKSTFGCSDIGLNPVTLTAIDESGNASVPTTALVTVVDVTAPTAITKDIVVTLNVSGMATIVAADVNNGSTDACGIASYSIDRTSFSCSDTDNPVTVYLTVTDIHGNVSSPTPALVTVRELVPPVARTRNITVQLDATGTVSILPSDINNGSTDNCSIASYRLSPSTFDCTNVGTNIVTLTAVDASGNEHSATATVTVQDNKAPIVLTKSFTTQLDATGTVTITPADVDNVSTDNCGIITYSLSKDTFTCANVGSNVISLTATDASGNSTSAFVTVIIEDNIAPVVVTKNIELVLNHGTVSIVPADVLVSATDACGVDITSYSLSQDTFTITDVLASPVTITVYATDVNGNVGSATATITFPTKPVEAVEVITPNGDGINDTWVIANITNHPKSIVRVYNTWGSIVFSAKNYQNNWDGKLNGSDVTLPDGGSYYYQVDLEGTGSIDSEGWLYITRQ